jgi:ligand-binding sensor domain-containing protein
MKKAYSFLCMSVLSIAAFGQNCWVDYTSSNTGLPPGASNAIERVGTDIWITTDYGVIKWDGNRLNVLKPTQIAIGASKTGPIKSLSEGLFIGSMKGLAEREYSSGNWHQYNVAYSGIISDSITAVNEDTTGHIFIGTLNGLSVVEGINWFNYTTANSGLPSNRIRCIHANDTSMWMGTDNGLVKWTYGSPTWTVYNAANTGNGLGSNMINDVFQDTSGTYWIATEQGVTRFDGSTWTKYTQLSTSNGLGSDQINAISQDGNGHLLVATDYGFAQQLKCLDTLL